MRKKISLIIILLCSLLFLTGCDRYVVDDKTKEEILEFLEKKEIIDSSWEFLMEDAQSDASTGALRYHEFYYSKSDGTYAYVKLEKSYLSSDSFSGDAFLPGGYLYYEIKITTCNEYDQSGAQKIKGCNSYGEDEVYYLHYEENGLIFKNEKLVIERAY